eukprot:10349243-Ditylum_brightwellii.AAC.1
MKCVKHDITYFGFQADGAVLLEDFCNNDNDDNNVNEVSKEEEGKGDDSIPLSTVSNDEKETAVQDSETMSINETKDNNDERRRKKLKQTNDK